MSLWRIVLIPQTVVRVIKKGSQVTPSLQREKVLKERTRFTFHSMF